MADEKNLLQETINPGEGIYSPISRAIISRFGLDKTADKSLIHRATTDAIPDILAFNKTSIDALQPGQKIEIPADILDKYLSAHIAPREEAVKKQPPPAETEKQAAKPASLSGAANQAFTDQAFREINIPGKQHTIKSGDNYTKIIKAHLSGFKDELKQLSSDEQRTIRLKLTKETEQLSETPANRLRLGQTITIPGLSYERIQNYAPKQNYTPIDNGHTIAPEIDNLITQTMRHSHIPEGLFRALILSESGGDPNAISQSDAMGLGQLKPNTAYSTAYEYVRSQDYKDAIALGNEQRNETLEKLAANIEKKGDSYRLKNGFTEQDAEKAILDPATNLTLSREHLKNALSLARNYLPSEYQDKEFNLLDIKFIYMCGSKGSAPLIEAYQAGKHDDSVSAHLKGEPFTNNKAFFVENGKTLTVGQTFDEMQRRLQEKTISNPEGLTAPVDLDKYKTSLIFNKENLQPQARADRDMSHENIAQQHTPDFGKFS